jgi:hypothetical protein
MRILILCAAVLSAAGCRKGEGLVTVELSATQSITGVTSLSVTRTDESAAAQTISSLPTSTIGTSPAPFFGVDVSADSTSTLALHIVAFRGADMVASGNGSAAVHGGKSASMNVKLTVSGTSSDMGSVDMGSVDMTSKDMGSVGMAAADMAASTPTLTVSTRSIGQATGSVHGTGIDCGSTCTASFSEGATVQLIAQPTAGYYFGGWSGDCISNLPTCTLVMNSSKQVAAQFTPANVVFTTSTQYAVSAIWSHGTGTTPAAKAVSGADAICGAAATAAGFPGTFVAWFSSNESNVLDRMKAANANHAAPHGWVRSDGLPVMNSPSDERIYYPPALSEQKSRPQTPSAMVWTGTNPDGSSTINCLDWSDSGNDATGGAGLWTGASRYWTYAGPPPLCGTNGSLYCFQVDYSAYVPAPQRPVQYKIIFGSQTPFDPSTGLSGADTVCDNEAFAAGLETTRGHFSAILAATNSAASRFILTGVPVIRVDNVVVAASDTVLLNTAPEVNAAVDLSASASQPLSTVWFGAAQPASAADVNCSGWTVNDGTASGETSALTTSYEWAFDSDTETLPCYSTNGVLCLQD